MPRRNSGPRLRFLEKRGVYYIVWTESGRSRERSTGTDDRERAEIKLAEFLRGRQSVNGPRDPVEVLLTDILADYALEHGPETMSPERIGYAMGPLLEFWIGKTAGNVARETCRAYGRWRNRSDGTVRRELGVLRAALNHAHSEGRVTRQIPVHLPDRLVPKDRFLTRNEAARLLLAALREPKVRLYLPLFVLFGLKTGARKEAILSLRWSQVDLETGRIDFNPIGRRRTNKRRAHTPIPKSLLPHLKRARLRGSDIGYVVNRDGRPLKDVKKGFASACARAGLDDVTPHTLRHTCATWLMQAGVDKWEVAGFLAMTMDTLERNYAHHHPDYLRKAAEAL